MGQIFFLGLLSVVSVVSLARPWIGVVAAYVITILTPQAVWYWNFQDIRPALWVLLPTMVGFVIGWARGEYKLGTAKNSRTMFLAVLWLFYTLSYYFGDYVSAGGPYRFTDPGWAYSTFNKIFILFFLACVCIDSERRLKALVGGLVVSAVYLIYWANDRYLSGQLIGRLAGPVDVYGVGIYSDENNFAMLFVVAFPFLWYVGHMFKQRLIRWGIWLVIPFGWHAVFLTASRGGLVGLAVVTLLIAWRSKNRLFSFLIIPAFAFVYFWQAGDLMKERAATIDDYQTETAASTRLEAWEAARGMIAAHPFVGVGLASFGPAFPDFSPNHPREAHNTFFQISAEAGVVAGLMYLVTLLTVILSLWRLGTTYRKQGAYQGSESAHDLYLLNEAILVAFCGFAVCSMFLSLQMFEIFYCLCLMANALLHIEKTRLAGQRRASEGAHGRQSLPTHGGLVRPAPLTRARST